MNQSFTIILCFTIFFLNSSERCYRSTEMPTTIEKILKTQEEIFESLWLKQEKEENLPKFGKEISKICPTIGSRLIRKTENDERKILGSGAYGRVFAVSLNNKDRAIKQASFDKYITNRLLKKLRGTQQQNLTCIESVLKAAKEQSFFIKRQNPVYNYQSRIVVWKKMTDHTTELQPINFELLDTAECKLISNAELEVNSYVRYYFQMLRDELGFLSKLSSIADREKRAGRAPSFPKFDFCIIHANLDVYFSMDKLDYSLYEVIKTCPQLIFAGHSGKRTKIYLQIMYQINILHKNRLSHCDVKPQNIVFSNGSYDSVYIVDFGLAIEGPCKGSSPDFEPIESFLKTMPREKIDPLTNLPQYLKHDAFSLGMTLLTIEVGLAAMENLFDEYDNLKADDTLSLQEKEASLSEIVDSMINDELEIRYPTKVWPEKSRNQKLDELIFDLIKNFLKLDYEIRLPVKAGLYQMYHLHKTAEDFYGELPESIETRLADNEKFVSNIKTKHWLDQVVLTLAPNLHRSVI